MPSVGRDKYGTYYLDLRKNGHGSRLSLRTKNGREAKEKATDWLNEHRDWTNFSVPHRITVDEFIPYYLAYVKPRVSAGYLRNIKIALARLRKEIGIPCLDRITITAATQFVTKLATAQRSIRLKDGEEKSLPPMSGRGVNGYIRTLRRVFEVAKSWKMISENPLAHVAKMKEEQLRPRALKREEARAFFAKMREMFPEYLPLFIVYLFTGLRRSEALSIGWDDIDWQENSILVRGKGQKYRAVPMLPVVKAILQSRRQLEKPFPWNNSTVTHKFVAVRKAVGISGVKLHDLRKSFGTLLADYGVNDFFISQWMGHEEGKTTRVHYIGAHDRETKKKLAKFEREIVAATLPRTLPTDASE